MRTLSKLSLRLFLLGAGITCLFAKEAPAATEGSRALDPAETSRSIGGLTFEERVAHQRAIEAVYWRHRIWPKDGLDPKPSLDAIVSQAQLEKKVGDYLRKSRLVGEQRGSLISRSELQTEMARIARHTKQPEVLRGLFAALGNDPLLIAECLARPIVAERLGAEPLLIQASWNKAPALSAHKLPEISASVECSDKTWTATSTVNAPGGRFPQAVVWTGTEMIIWGGGNSPYNTGGKYNPSTDSWTPTGLANAPVGRGSHRAV